MKNTHGAVEDAVHVGDGKAIVADGHSGFDSGGQTGGELFGCHHATAALDNQSIVGQSRRRGAVGRVDDGRKSRYDIATQLLACIFGEELGQFYTSDVFAGNVVGAAFEHQHTVAVLKAVDGGGSFYILVEEAFGTCQHNAERGEEDLVGDDFGDHAVDLAVGDNQAGGLLELGEGVGEFGFATNHGAGVVVEYVTQHLHLGQNHASLGCGGIDGSHHDDGVAFTDYVTKEGAVDVGRFGEGFADAGGERFAQREVFDGENEDAGVVIVLNPFDELRVGLETVGLGINQHKGDTALAAGIDKHHLFGFETIVGEEDKGEVGLSEHLETFFNAEASHGAFIVDAGGVDPDHGSYAANLHSFLDGVGGGAGQIGYDGYLLPGEEIDEGAFAVIAASEDADMGFEFVSFHTVITQGRLFYCSKGMKN